MVISALVRPQPGLACIRSLLGLVPLALPHQAEDEAVFILREALSQPPRQMFMQSNIYRLRYSIGDKNAKRPV